MGWIEVEIAARGGAVPFPDFMELALYHPVHGYYAAGPARCGRRGDFLTGPTASPWYAAVLARWILAVVARLGPLVLVDLGSGDGSFLGRVLERLGPAAASCLQRVISVERSAAMRAQQVELLAGRRPQVDIVGELLDVGRATGTVLVHASELYDALPVHRGVQREDGLEELWVAAGPDGLVWQERAAPAELVAYFAHHRVALAPGQLAEADLAARTLHADLLRWAGERAVAVVLDYGYPAARLYDPRGRRSGSLACYRGHRLNRDPLLDPGEQDITAHVNWDDLRLAATDAGWQEVGLWGLGELLLRAGLAVEVEERGLGLAAELTADTYAERQEVKRLLDPEGMGSDLKVLVQATPSVLPVAMELLRRSYPPG